MKAHPRPKATEFVSLLHDGNPRDHQTLPSTRGVGHFAGFQRRLLSCSNKSKVAEVLMIPSQQSDISIHRSTFWPVDGSVVVHQGRQGSQVDGSGVGYSNPPIPRRLVTESPVPGNVPTTDPDPLGPMSRSRVDNQSFKVGTGSTTGFQLCRLSFQPLSRSENQPSFRRPAQSGSSWTAIEKQVVSGRLHEAYSMAFKEALACRRNPGKDHSLAKVSPCSPEVVVGPKQGSVRSTFTPLTTRPPTVYRRLKRRLGRTLRRLHCKRPLVQARRRLAHKFARAQSGFVGPKTVRAFVLEQDHPCLHRQDNSGFLHQQAGGYEIRLSLCPPLETPVVVQPETNCVMGQTHSGSPECHCRQAVQTQTGDSDGVVSPSRGFRPTLSEVAQTGSGSFCNQIQS